MIRLLKNLLSSNKEEEDSTVAQIAKQLKYNRMDVHVIALPKKHFVILGRSALTPLFFVKFHVTTGKHSLFINRLGSKTIIDLRVLAVLHLALDVHRVFEEYLSFSLDNRKVTFGPAALNDIPSQGELTIHELLTMDQQ